MYIKKKTTLKVRAHWVVREGHRKRNGVLDKEKIIIQSLKVRALQVMREGRTDKGERAEPWTKRR